jgi:Phage tail tube protein, GTA-gp10
MAANARRGEISARLDGKEYRFCLTLGALAELETALGAGDLVALGERFARHDCRDWRWSARRRACTV